METLSALLKYLERKEQSDHGRIFLGLFLLTARKWSSNTGKLRLIQVILVFGRELRCFTLDILVIEYCEP
jgi:hypothetical protein